MGFREWNVGWRRSRPSLPNISLPTPKSAPTTPPTTKTITKVPPYETKLNGVPGMVIDGKFVSIEEILGPALFSSLPKSTNPHSTTTTQGSVVGVGPQGQSPCSTAPAGVAPSAGRGHVQPIHTKITSPLPLVKNKNGKQKWAPKPTPLHLVDRQ